MKRFINTILIALISLSCVSLHAQNLRPNSPIQTKNINPSNTTVSIESREKDKQLDKKQKSPSSNRVDDTKTRAKETVRDIKEQAKGAVREAYDNQSTPISSKSQENKPKGTLKSTDTYKYPDLEFYVPDDSNIVEVKKSHDRISGEIIIPSSVKINGTNYTITKICAEAFSRCKDITSVSIPNTVTLIEEEAFLDCKSMTSVNIPSSVKKIEAYAFDGCSSLHKVEISDLEAWCRIDFDNYASNPLNCAHHLYLNQEEITHLTIPSSISVIKNYTFYGCSGIKSITFPNSVKEIDEAAFKDCKGLTSVTFPNSVTRIGYSAFMNCTGLISVTFPNSITSIGGQAFMDCTSLESITIPDSVKKISDWTFKGCTGLTSITVPVSYNTLDGFNFSDYKNLKKIYIPSILRRYETEIRKSCPKAKVKIIN